MHYFSLHTRQGSHLGFLIMLPDDESENPPQSGRFAVKLQEGAHSDPAARALEALQNTETPLCWAVEKDHVSLFDGAAAVGRIRGEHLTIGGQTLLLNDLTGSV